VFNQHEDRIVHMAGTLFYYSVETNTRNMKKIIAGVALLTVGKLSTAQNVSIGPVVGVSHAWITGVENTTFKPSVNIGGTLVYSFVPHWGIGGDIRASFFEGVRTKTESGSTKQVTNINATYLRIPMKVYHFFGKYGDRVRPKIYVGPEVGFFLGGKTKTETTVGGNTSEVKTDSKDGFKSFDFGFVAGGGINYRLKKNVWLNVDLVYNNGLIDISEGESYNANRNLGLSAGVTFPLGTVLPSKQ
jgi:outer membrane protein W